MRGWWPKMMHDWGSLLGPDLVCEVVLHIVPQGPPKMYVSKLESQQAAQRVVNDLLKMTNDFAAQNGITIQWENIAQAFGRKA